MSVWHPGVQDVVRRRYCSQPKEAESRAGKGNCPVSRYQACLVFQLPRVSKQSGPPDLCFLRSCSTALRPRTAVNVTIRLGGRRWNRPSLGSGARDERSTRLKGRLTLLKEGEVEYSCFQRLRAVIRFARIFRRPFSRCIELRDPFPSDCLVGRADYRCTVQHATGPARGSSVDLNSPSFQLPLCPFPDLNIINPTESTHDRTQHSFCRRYPSEKY